MLDLLSYIWECAFFFFSDWFINCDFSVFYYLFAIILVVLIFGHVVRSSRKF